MSKSVEIRTVPLPAEHSATKDKQNTLWGAGLLHNVVCIPNNDGAYEPFTETKHGFYIDDTSALRLRTSLEPREACPTLQ